MVQQDSLHSSCLFPAPVLGFFWLRGVSGSFGDTHIPFFGELAKLLKSLASLYTIFLTETSFWARLSLLILLYILRYSKNSEKPTVYGD